MSLGKPPRLDHIFQKYDPPVYFVTFCTKSGRTALANIAVNGAVTSYGREAERRGIALGRYVIMPDHIHLFVAGPFDFDLGLWVRGLKRVVAAAVTGGREDLWQRGFFDHVIRRSESFEQKWQYVYHNPVRAGLVSRADEWPYQGEIVPL